VCLFQIHTHGSNWKSFHEQVPKEVLPTEYGGEAGTLQENWGTNGKTFLVNDQLDAKLLFYVFISSSDLHTFRPPT
jgi:hypothetical protein